MKLQKKTAIAAICLVVSLSCLRAKTQAINADSPIMVLLGMLVALSQPPNFSPAPGTFDRPQTITISHRNQVPVRYTLDGTTTPSCTVGQVYDEKDKVKLELGKYTLQAVECFEGFSSSLGKGDYSITGTFGYTGLSNGNLTFFIGSTNIYPPTGLDPAGVYRFTVAPALPTCITLNATTGVLSGTCSVSQAASSFRFTASRQNGNKEDLFLSTNIGIFGWTNEAYLKPPNIDASDNFGNSVSISGDTIAIGSWQEDSNQTTITNGTTASSDNSAANSGAVYVFRRTGSTWAQEAYLKAPNSEAADNFGQSVSILGDTIVVGAFGEDSNQTTITNGITSAGNGLGASGAAYVYKRTGSTWAQEAYLKAPNADVGDNFGFSVSISGDTIVVGARTEASNQTTITNGTTASANNSASQAGAAYVFRRNASIWTNEAYLKAPNTPISVGSDQFGISVSISGDTIVVGAWQENSNQTTITNGTTASGDNSVFAAGAAYVFKRTGTNWASEAFLKAPNAEGDDNFGQSVSISGDTIVIGAAGEDSNQTTITNGTTASSDNSSANSGAAYVFRRSGVTWTNEAYLKAPNPDSGDSFGYSVSISGDTIVVGAISESSNQTTITNGTAASSNNSASQSGAAYIFQRTGTTWSQQAFLKAPNAEATDQFGFSVSISGDTIVVGSQLEDSLQTTITNGTLVQASDVASSNNAGAAYVFRLR